MTWRWGSGCGLGPEHNVVAQCAETADEAPGGAVEVIGTKIGEGNGVLPGAELATLTVERDPLHSGWNYTNSLDQQLPRSSYFAST